MKKLNFAEVSKNLVLKIICWVIQIIICRMPKLFVRLLKFLQYYYRVYKHPIYNFDDAKLFSNLYLIKFFNNSTKSFFSYN